MRLPEQKVEGARNLGLLRQTLAYSTEQFSTNSSGTQCFMAILKNTHLWEQLISLSHISVGKHRQV